MNALAITGSEPFLERVFPRQRDRRAGGVRAGGGGYADYPEAIRRKLIAEVTMPVTRRPRAGRAEAGR